MLVIRSEDLLRRVEAVAKAHGERNMALLAAKGKADETKHGDKFLGRNEVVIA